ncbi:hypothetical protein LshimejAT787_1303490 [Lyophyllum shimeji]|uniref:Uncharacterized protein n=1 Tax=Lyophyllum shimeji TaxID=47721 RepID=A0A9P3USA7_LYOSH|nr:hypothetical protein LshimejAT787_1303490 [Lyophyllum shimeji]
MDTNWCLSCDCHFEGSGPYCSPDCQDKAGPSRCYDPPSEYYSDNEEFDDEVIYHQVDDTQVHAQWTGNGAAGILAWAAEIPPASPPSAGSSRSCSRTPSRATSISRLPKLLRPHRRLAPPALCVSTPQPVVPPPTRPILTQQYAAFCSRVSLDAESMGKTSIFSGATESSLATPASTLAVPIASPRSKSSILGAITTHVRSWVAQTSPAIASPSSPTQPKNRISPATAMANEPHKFTIVAHTQSSFAPDLSYSSLDDADLKWRFSTAGPPARERPRARGRKLSRK